MTDHTEVHLNAVTFNLCLNIQDIQFREEHYHHQSRNNNTFKTLRKVHSVSKYLEQVDHRASK